MNYSIILESLNNNTGIISIIGLFVVIPLAILSDKIISYLKSRKYNKELKQILLQELWLNLNYVAQIEVSYRNQLDDLENFHIPNSPPRTHVLGKFFDFNLLNSLEKFEKEKTIAIFGLLEDLKYDFSYFKGYLVSVQKIDEIEYKKNCSTMLNFINPVMSNMLDLWVCLVKDIGAKSNISQIEDLNKIILKKIKDGKWIRSSYRSSFFDKVKYQNMPKFDVILCWENDWEDSNKDVLEIRNLVAIYGNGTDLIKKNKAELTEIPKP